MSKLKARLYLWWKWLFRIDIPELDYHITFFTSHGGWTSFTFDNGSYYHGEITIPESFEGDKPCYFRWFDVVPSNKGLVEEFIYEQYQKECSS